MICFASSKHDVLSSIFPQSVPLASQRVLLTGPWLRTASLSATRMEINSRLFEAAASSESGARRHILALTGLEADLL